MMRALTCFGRKVQPILLLLGLGWLMVGCQPTASQSPPKVTVAEVSAPSEPAEVELSNAKVELVPPEILKFEVEYRFTKGKPTKNYMCELKFPGTENVGRKPMSAWELKDSGRIKGAIEVQSQAVPVQSFEILFSEAEEPQRGYDKISNILTGQVSGTESAKAP